MSNSSNYLVRLLFIVYIQVKSAQMQAREAFLCARRQTEMRKNSHKTVNL